VEEEKLIWSCNWVVSNEDATLTDFTPFCTRRVCLLCVCVCEWPFR